jgi:hypothetical protein
MRKKLFAKTVFYYRKTQKIRDLFYSRKSKIVYEIISPDGESLGIWGDATVLHREGFMSEGYKFIPVVKYHNSSNKTVGGIAVKVRPYARDTSKVCVVLDSATNEEFSREPNNLERFVYRSTGEKPIDKTHRYRVGCLDGE